MLIYVTMYFVSSPQMVDKILKGERAESPEAGEPQTKRFACFLFLRKSEIQFFFSKLGGNTLLPSLFYVVSCFLRFSLTSMQILGVAKAIMRPADFALPHYLRQFLSP